MCVWNQIVLLSQGIEYWNLITFGGGIILEGCTKRALDFSVYNV